MKTPSFYGKTGYWLALMLGCLLVLNGCDNHNTFPRDVTPPNEQPPTEQPPTEQPPVEQPPTEQPPETQQVNISGRVIGGTEAAGFILTQINESGETITTWTTDAQGHYAVEIPASSFYHLLATPIQANTGTQGLPKPIRLKSAAGESQAVAATDVQPLEALCESNEPTLTCNITPWTTLLLTLAHVQDISIDEVANELQSMSYYHLPSREDPFILFEEGTLNADDFDAASVLALISQTDGISQWLTAMSNWVAAPDKADIPASVPKFTVSTQISEGGTVTPTEQQVARNQSLSLAVYPAQGYRISSVNGCGGTLTQTTYQTGAVTADCQVSVTFSLLQYSLAYQASQGGTLQGSTSQHVAYGASGSTVTAIPDEGYHFVEWSDGNLTNPRIDSNITTDLTLSAVFAINSYQILYTAGNGGNIHGTSSQNINHGAGASTVSAIPDVGYVFVKWSDDVVANPRTDVNITANKSVEAIFDAAQYSLTYTASTGGSLTGVASQTISHGNDGSAVTAVPDAGYVFVKWSDDVTSNPRTDVNVTANQSVEAIFDVAQYSLTYTAGNGGSLTGVASQTISHGNDGSAVTAVPDVGYVFVKWSDDVVENPRTDVNITANQSVEAIFDVAQYSLTYTAGTGGSLTGVASQTISHGNDGSAVAAVPDVGYVFVKWSDDVVENPRTDVNITANQSVEAIFDVAQYSLTYTAGNGGSLTGVASQTISHGNDGSAVTAVPDVGYMFIKWSDEVTDNPRTDLNITANQSVEALFDVAQYTVTYSAENGGSISGQSSQTISHGNNASSVTVVANNGFMFHQWNDGSTDNPRTDVNVTGNIAVTATFTRTEILLNVAEEYREIINNTSTAQTLSLMNNSGSNAQYLLVPMNFTRDADLPLTIAATNNLAPNSANSPQPPTLTQDPYLVNRKIIDSRRIAAGYDFEESWLNEALAAIAQEKVFLLRAGLNPLQNITAANLTTGPTASIKVNAYNTYMNGYFGYYRPWLQAPTRLGVLDSAGNQAASRGLHWAFLRYVADRHADSSLAIEADLYRDLVDSPYSGIANIENLINDDANQWLHDFLMSVYLDDYGMAGLPPVTTGIYSASSWNYRALYTTLNGSYQLQEMALPVEGSTTLIYTKGGSAAYIRFAVGAGESATLTFTPTSVPDQQASYTLIRLQ